MVRPTIQNRRQNRERKTSVQSPRARKGRCHAEGIFLANPSPNSLGPIAFEKNQRDLELRR